VLARLIDFLKLVRTTNSTVFQLYRDVIRGVLTQPNSYRKRLEGGVWGWVKPQSEGRKLRLSHQFRSETTGQGDLFPLAPTSPLSPRRLSWAESSAWSPFFLRFPLSLQLTIFSQLRTEGIDAADGPRPTRVGSWHNGAAVSRCPRSVHPPSDAYGTQS